MTHQRFALIIYGPLQTSNIADIDKPSRGQLTGHWSTRALDNSPVDFMSIRRICVKLHLRHKQTNLQRDTSVCLFVCLSVVSVSGVHPMDVRSYMLRRNLRGGG